MPDTNGAGVYLFDRQTRTTVKVSHPPGNPQSHGNNASWLGLALSQDGRYLAYESDASNPSSPHNSDQTDVFGYQTATGVISRLSHVPDEPLRGVNGDVQLVTSSPTAATCCSPAPPPT